MSSVRRSHPTSRREALRHRVAPRSGLALLAVWIALGGCSQAGDEGVETAVIVNRAQSNLASRSNPGLPPASLRGRTSDLAEANLSDFPTTGEPRGWKYIVVHHSATSSGSVASIDEAHRQRVDANGHPWRGIGYHFVIGNGDGLADGTIEPTFRWREQSEGAHAGIAEFNELGVGICLIGNFDESPPTRRQLAAVRGLIARLQREYGIDDDRVLTHRDLKATACPGAHFRLSDVLRGRDAAAVGRPSAGP